MDVLKSGIGLRGWGQHDPKIEYKTEAGRMFGNMMVNIADHVTDVLFHVHVAERDNRQVRGIWRGADARHDDFNTAADAERGRQAAQHAGEHRPIEPIRTGRKVGRNEPCPCGSGKKYKQCCGRTNR